MVTVILDRVCGDRPEVYKQQIGHASNLTCCMVPDVSDVLISVYSGRAAHVYLVVLL